MLTVKALHIIFIVTWFAGLFYIVRLFVYAAEASAMDQPKGGILSEQYKIMMRRLWFGITWPSMVLTLLFGFWMVALVPEFLSQTWFIVKLIMVAGLMLYHGWCQIVFRRFSRDLNKKSGNHYRMMNEVATLFLVSIVFVVVQKSSTDWMKALLGLLVLSLALMAAIKLYKRVREGKKTTS